jgi:hypothetical protein
MSGSSDGPASETFEDRLIKALDEAIRLEKLIISDADRRSLGQALMAQVTAIGSDRVIGASVDSLVVFCRAVIFGARWKFEAQAKYS